MILVLSEKQFYQEIEIKLSEKVEKLFLAGRDEGEGMLKVFFFGYR